MALGLPRGSADNTVVWALAGWLQKPAKNKKTSKVMWGLMVFINRGLTVGFIVIKRF
ncbi:MAG TPA: hypothetical protein VFB55_03810 [Verrucomicrobiae bacterium]|nr:hypothetical protein [Verrucomicrobiae bacterium]